MAAKRKSFADRARAKRRKRKPKIPPRAARFAKSVREPRGPALAFQLGLARLFDRYAKAVRGALYHRLDQWAKSGAERHDASDDKPPSVKGLRKPALRSVPPAAVESLSDKVAGQTEKHSRAEFQRIGISLREEPRLSKAIDDWRADNVSRVSGILEDEVDKLEALLSESEGRTVDELRDRIEERLDVAKSKAEYLARNQTSTLNGQITQARQQAAGIEEFVWTCAGDARSRQSHVDLDGQRFRWDDPPIVDDYPAIPGEPPNCRCVAYPVLPELEDEAPDDEEAA